MIGQGPRPKHDVCHLTKESCCMLSSRQQLCWTGDCCRLGGWKTKSRSGPLRRSLSWLDEQPRHTSTARVEVWSTKSSVHLQSNAGTLLQQKIRTFYTSVTIFSTKITTTSSQNVRYPPKSFNILLFPNLTLLSQQRQQQQRNPPSSSRHPLPYIQPQHPYPNYPK